VRYVDDLLLFGDDKRELWEWLAHAAHGDTLRLRTNLLRQHLI